MEYILDILKSEEFNEILNKNLNDKNLKNFELFNIFFNTLSEFTKREFSKKEQKELFLIHYLKCNELQENIIEINDVLHENIDKSIKYIEEKNIKNLEATKIEVENLKKYMESIEKEIYLDDLTKLKNRKYINYKILKNGKFTQNGILFVLDLNDFKSINDIYGHNIGDLALKIFSTFLKNNLSKINNTHVIRYSGDEFVIICQNKNNLINVSKIIKTLREELLIKKFTFKNNKKKEFHVNFSYGNENFCIGDEFCYKFDLADKKMYKHKETFKK